MTRSPRPRRRRTLLTSLPGLVLMAAVVAVVIILVGWWQAPLEPAEPRFPPARQPARDAQLLERPPLPSVPVTSATEAADVAALAPRTAQSLLTLPAWPRPEPPRATLTGVVLDEEGQPVPDAEVVLRAHMPLTHAAMPVGSSRSARTDASGRFQFNRVDVSRPLMWAARHGPHFSATSTHLRVQPGARLDLGAAVLAAEDEHTGSVSNQAGDPLEGARVHVQWLYSPWPEQVAHTDGDGVYAVAMPPEDCAFQLEVHATGHASAARTWGSDHSSLPRFTLAPGHTRSGRVVDADGEPVGAAVLSAHVFVENLAPRLVASVDPDTGRFQLQGLVPGPTPVAVEAPDHAPRSLILEEDDVTIQLLRRAQVELLVFDDAATPAVRFDVLVFREPFTLPELSALRWQEQVWTRYTFGPEAEGRARIPGLGRGIHNLVAVGAGDTLSEIVRTPVKASGSSAAGMAFLLPAARLSVHVHDAVSGRPLVGVEVDVRSSGTTIPGGQGWTDGSGVLHVDHVAPGLLNVRARRHDYVLALATVTCEGETVVSMAMQPRQTR